jgi:hypothetical protein
MNTLKVSAQIVKLNCKEKQLEPQPNADVVEIISDMLEEAKAGRVTGVVAMTFVHSEGSGGDWETHWANASFREIIFAAGILQYEAAKKAEGE